MPCSKTDSEKTANNETNEDAADLQIFLSPPEAKLVRDFKAKYGYDTFKKVVANHVLVATRLFESDHIRYYDLLRS